MFEIIPTINAADWATVEQRFRRIGPYTEWIEVDVSDGKFTRAATWNNPADLKTLKLEKQVRVAVHLMVYNPEKIIKDWISAGVRRITVQYEGIRAGFIGGKGAKIRAMAATCKENWVEFGLSLTTRTAVSAIRPFLPLVQVVQVLAVEPGPSGQQAKPEAYAMVAELRGIKGNFKIEWDGGVTLANIREIRSAGADLAAAASAIFGAAEPEKALELLKRELLG